MRVKCLVTAATILLTPAPAARVAGAQAESGPCDRACLVGITDRYLTAMAVHDPARAPVARTFKFTENTGLVSLGEGLWVGTTEGPTTFRIYVADPLTGQVGFFGVLKEFDRPVLLALRLKVENRLITEIEHIVARNLNEVGLKNLVTPRTALLTSVPAAGRTSRAEMLRIANSYYDSIEQSDGDLTPYADDCVRRENGLQTTTNTPAPGAGRGGAASPFALLGALGCRDGLNTRGLSYISRINARRLVAVDEEQGLVFALSMFRHKGDVRSIEIVGVPGLDTMPMDFGPIDLEAAHIFKITGGQMHEIEAMGFTLPYNSSNGWGQ